MSSEGADRTQKQLLRCAEMSFEEDETRRKISGQEEALSRVLKAARGDFTLPLLQEYGKWMSRSDLWDKLPREVHHHALSVSTFRSLAAASASTEILLHRAALPFKFKSFLLIDFAHNSPA